MFENIMKICLTAVFVFCLMLASTDANRRRTSNSRVAGRRRNVDRIQLRQQNMPSTAISRRQRQYGCDWREWQCNDGSQCIPNSKYNDGIVDCKDKSDEPNLFQCGSGKWTCNNGECIPGYYHNDTFNDCSDCSDEQNGNWTSKCAVNNCKGRFECADGLRCIDLNKRNDKTVHCIDCSDEKIEDWNWFGNYCFDRLGCGKPLHKPKRTSWHWKGHQSQQTSSRAAATRRVANAGQRRPRASTGRRPAERSLILRIDNGNEAVEHSWPWQIHFRDKRCGGTIVSKNLIVTAAHCFIDDRNGSVHHFYAGLHDRTDVDAATLLSGTLVKYESYDVNRALHNDVALIKLRYPIPWSDKILPACLAQKTAEKGTPCIVTGWGGQMNYGTLSDTITKLNQARVKITDCVGVPDATFTHLCALGKRVADAALIESPCSGDSGGPLVCQADDLSWNLHGVVSGGPEECGSSADWVNGAALYTDVAEPSIANFIKRGLLDADSS